MDKQEREAWTRVIDVYKQWPHMWDKNNKHYFNRTMRNQIFQTMFDVYCGLATDSHINFTSFKKKFENMRTSYSRELKKVHASKQTESSDDDVYKPSLWYYNLFASWEDTTEPPSRGIDPIDTVEVSQDSESNETSNGKSNSDTNQTWMSQPCTSLSINQSLSKRQIKIEEEEETTLKRQRINLDRKQEILSETTQKLNTATMEDWEIIGKSIGLQLRDLCKRQQIIAQKLISDAIFYGNLEKLTENSYITLRNELLID